jgi:tetratricopeptide (TPR) repeat protein
MHPSVVRGLGLLASVIYGTLIVWLYATQPQTVAQVTGGLTASIGAYSIDRQAFQDGLAFFRRDQFDEARAAFARADPAQRDADTQFYIAYSYYRQGWGRVYNDNAQYKEGLTAVERAIALAPNHRIVVDDTQLVMHTGDELRAELQRGLTHEVSDYNPLRLFGKRK